MDPVVGPKTDGDYIGQRVGPDGEVLNPGVGNLPFHREDGTVVSYWKPSESELKALNEGGYVLLGIHVEPIPPVSLNVCDPEGERVPVAGPAQEEMMQRIEKLGALGVADEWGRFICAGCNVRGVHEHRCHGMDGPITCQCPECREDPDG